MKSIANSDFSLLTEKLPIILRYASRHIPPSDRKALNALRVLKKLHTTLITKHSQKQNTYGNDKE